MSGAYQLLPNHDRAGRGILIIRNALFEFSPDNLKSICRCLWYVHSIIEDDDTIQRNGIVVISDYGGEWKSSPINFLRLMAVFPLDAIPFYYACTHYLCGNPSSHALIQSLRKLMPSELRVRARSHFGSPLEIQHALRTFGIDLSLRQVPINQRDENSSSDGGDNEDHQDDVIEKDIRRRQQLDTKWRLTEDSYRWFVSPVACFPNPQDIIMGRNKAVGQTWPGNIRYRTIIEEYVSRYIKEQDCTSHRINKTFISVEILHILHNKYESRFLNREETRWVVIDDVEAQVKISQALRMLARAIVSR